MTRFLRSCFLLLPLVSGCSSYDIDSSIDSVNQMPDVISSGQATLVLDAKTKQKMDDRANFLLKSELNENAAVELMLSKSLDFQTLLLENWRQGSLFVQSGNIANPSFSYERMVKGAETEYGSFLSFGLFELLTLPNRRASAKIDAERSKVQLASEILGAVTEVRIAWLDAVAAEEKLAIAEKKFQAMKAVAELAKRMKQTGNFNTSQRIRQQLTFSDATMALANARQLRFSSRERLIRLLGIEQDQINLLKLPKALQDFTDKPMRLDQFSNAINARFDVRIARLEYEATLKRFGVENIGTYTDVEYGHRYDRINDDGAISNKKGYELEVKLPLFDWGNVKREALRAELLSKQKMYQSAVLRAASELREQYFEFRTLFDIALHYQNQVIPMKETLMEEANYEYNGMIIGVFELLQVGRELAAAEISLVDAKQNALGSEMRMRSSALGRASSSNSKKLEASTAAEEGGH